MALSPNSPNALSDERRSAFVCGIVELLLDHGYSYAQISREANACLSAEERARIEKRFRTKKGAVEPLSDAAIRMFVDRHKKRNPNDKAPSGAALEILYLYLNREKRRFPSFISEYVLLYRDSFLDPEIVPAGALNADPREVFKNFLVAAGYRVFARLLNVDYLTIRKSAKDIEGEYICVRRSSRDKDKIVTSRITLRERPHAEEIWEYRHYVETEHRDQRETDGMVLALDRHIILFGDVAGGHGLEMLVIDRPGLARPNVLSGVMLTLSLSGRPIVGQFALIKKKEGQTVLCGVSRYENCVDDLLATSVIADQEQIEADKERVKRILSALNGPSTAMPIFENNWARDDSLGN